MRNILSRPGEASQIRCHPPLQQTPEAARQVSRPVGFTAGVEVGGRVEIVEEGEVLTGDVDPDASPSTRHRAAAMPARR